jgi:predicted RNase H-like HicB family nuclease
VAHFSKMRELTAIVRPGDRDEGGFWATCLELPGANGQGETPDECLTDLVSAARLLIDLEREEIRKVSPDAEEILITI